VSGKRFDVKVIGPPATGAANGAAAGRAYQTQPGSARPTPKRAARPAAGGGAGETLVSPLQGTVLKVSVQPGAVVEQGALICVIEAMKMENEITAHRSGTVTELPVAVGASVATGDTLAVITSGSGS
jgi:acetyl-CoA/propionyl-CoA carboxylase biotin carboxyl carrier protein